MHYLSKMKNLYVYLTMLFVVLTYAIFTYTCDFRGESISPSPYSHYQYLTESFLKGHVNLLITPPAEYLKVSNPYDFKQFRGIKLEDGTYLKRLYDASFYKNKFYLYFGPLPVIFFFAPFKLITGFYSTTALGVFFFLSIGFCIQYALLFRIKEGYFNDISSTQMVLSGFVLGFAWPLLILAACSSHLEAAIASAYCFMSLALFYLYNVFVYSCRGKDVFIFSLCLSLSVAGRPQFSLICMFVYPFLMMYMYKNKNVFSLYLKLILPAIIIGSLLAYYNYLRFDSIFVFGQKYQIPGSDYHDLYQGLFQFKNVLSNIGFGFYQYFIRPFPVYAYVIPYIDHILYEPGIYKNYYFYTNSVGIIMTTPFVLLVLLFPLLMKFYFNNNTLRPLLIFLLVISFIVLIVVGCILSISFGAPRYEADFAPYLIMLAIICLWLSKNYLSSRVYKIANLFYVITGILSIYIGFWIGATTKPIYSSKIHFHFLMHSISIDLNYVVFYSLLIIFLFAIVPRGLAFLRSRF